VGLRFNSAGIALTAPYGVIEGVWYFDAGILIARGGAVRGCQECELMFCECERGELPDLFWRCRVRTSPRGIRQID
jgi:hypothetical protein